MLHPLKSEVGSYPVRLRCQPPCVYLFPQMSDVLLENGRVIDPANNFDATASVWLSEGKVKAVGNDLKVPDSVERIDVSGKVVTPGLVDLHVHFREPGQSKKETIKTGMDAAAKGGFTSVVCMPNTTPSIDSPSTVALLDEQVQKVRKDGHIHVYTTGCLTKGIEGEELAPIGSLFKAGVVAITDDGKCIQNNELMRRACEYARMFDIPVMDHCQDYGLVTDGVMNEGYWSTSLGLRGWPSAGEDLIVARNILLAEQTGTHIHCQHISSAKSVDLIREAKAKGIKISGEACAHHFTLTDASIAGSEVFWKEDGKQIFGDKYQASELPQWPAYETRCKMNPPLRTAADREAVIAGVADGALEILASDHAPHCDYEKEVEFDIAPFGITGLETELSLSLMQLVHSGRMSLSEMIRRYTEAPAKLCKLDAGTLSVGAPGDVTVIDVDKEWSFKRESTASKSINSPFYDWPLKGMAVMTIADGNVIWKE